MINPVGPVPWPTTLQGVSFELFLRDINGGTTLPAVQDPSTVATPNAVQWNALFPTTTPVTPYGQTQDQKGYDHRRLRSFPVGNVADFLASRYGQFGLETPTEFPSYDDLVQNTAFGPIGFEGGADDTGGNGDGPTRKQNLINGLESQFDVGPGSTPADWAIPYDPTCWPASTAWAAGLPPARAVPEARPRAQARDPSHRGPWCRSSTSTRPSH